MKINPTLQRLEDFLSLLESTEQLEKGTLRRQIAEHTIEKMNFELDKDLTELVNNVDISEYE